MSSFFDRDLSGLDWWDLSPEERTAVTSEAVRLAKALRTEFLRELGRRLWSWWRARRNSCSEKTLRPGSETVSSTLFRRCV
jgi:hypothetical protein